MTLRSKPRVSNGWSNWARNSGPAIAIISSDDSKCRFAVATHRDCWRYTIVFCDLVFASTKEIAVLRSSRILSAAAMFSLAACSGASSEPTPLAQGSWSVDAAASSLSYVSVKAGEIAEANSFSGLSGSVTAEGAASLEIDLATVETKVDIRNERMRDIFFEVAQFPTATVTAQIDPAAFEALGVGESTVQPLEATLSVKGVETSVETKVSVTRTGEDDVLVTSVEPVIVYADALELTDGLATLQELAGLPSIAPVVPVSFSIAFER